MVKEERRGKILYVLQKGDRLHIEHYIGKRSRTKEWFEKLGKNKEELRKWLGSENLDLVKAGNLKKSWKERDKEKKKIAGGKGAEQKQIGERE